MRWPSPSSLPRKLRHTEPTPGTFPPALGRHPAPPPAPQDPSPLARASRLAPPTAENGTSRNADNLGWFGWFGAGGGSVGRDPAWPAHRCWLGRPDDDDRLGRRQRRTRPGAMVGTFDAEVRHLALDHPGEGPQPPGGQQPLGDLPRDARQRPSRRLRGGWPPTPARWW